MEIEENTNEPTLNHKAESNVIYVPDDLSMISHDSKVNIGKEDVQFLIILFKIAFSSILNTDEGTVPDNFDALDTKIKVHCCQ